MKLKVAFCSLIAVVITGCSGESDTISKMDLFMMARETYPDVELILPKDMNSGVKCSEYGDGCVSGKFIKIHRLVFPAVEFETSEAACKSAFNIDQYCYKNWVFDDVVGEPILERYIKKTFKAKRPAKIIEKKEED